MNIPLTQNIIYDIQVSANTLIASADNYLNQDKFLIVIEQLRVNLVQLSAPVKTEQQLQDELIKLADELLIVSATVNTYTQKSSVKNYRKTRATLYELRNNLHD